MPRARNAVARRPGRARGGLLAATGAAARRRHATDHRPALRGHRLPEPAASLRGARRRCAAGRRARSRLPHRLRRRQRGGVARGPHRARSGGARWAVGAGRRPAAQRALRGAVVPDRVHGRARPRGLAARGHREESPSTTCASPARIDVDVDPRAMVLSEDGASLVVTHFFEQGLADALESPEDIEFARGRAVRIDPEDFADPSGANPPKTRACVGSSGLSLSRPDGARAMVACYGEDALAVVPLDEPEGEATRFPSVTPRACPARRSTVRRRRCSPRTGRAWPCPAPSPATCASSRSPMARSRARRCRASARRAPRCTPATARACSCPRAIPARWWRSRWRRGPSCRAPSIAAGECSRPLELAHAGAGRLLLRCGDGALMLLDAADLSVVTRAFLGAPASAAALLAPGGAR